MKKQKIYQVLKAQDQIQQYRLLALLVIICLLLTSCGNDKLQKLSYADTILAFGDSLTIGVGVAQSESYPSILATLSDRTVVNAGISGETTAEGLARFDEALRSAQPALVLLLEGGNDILRNMPATETKNNLDQMITMAKAFGADVVLIGVPEKNLFTSAHPIYQELADQHDLLFIENIISSLIKKPKFKSDSVHFNAAGYRVLAEEIHGALVKNGAL